MGRRREILFLVLIMLIIVATVFMVKDIKQSSQSDTTVSTSESSRKGSKDSRASSSASSTESTEPAKTTESTSTTVSSETTPPMNQNLQLAINDIESLGGEVAYGVYYFQGEQYYSNENKLPLISASVIKVFIMEYIFMKELDLQTVVNGETVSALMERMIQISDNDATNQLIDLIGFDELNQYFQEVGYTDTVLNRKMLDLSNQGERSENYTSLKDTMTFLQNLYQQQEQAPYNQMLEILLGQQVKTKIASKVGNEIPIANKTGELSDVENDIGIVFSETPFAIVVLTNGVENTSAMRQAIGDLAYVATYGR